MGQAPKTRWACLKRNAGSPARRMRIMQALVLRCTIATDAIFRLARPLTPSLIRPRERPDPKSFPRRDQVNARSHSALYATGLRFPETRRRP
jgi:hypothetical protein